MSVVLHIECAGFPRRVVVSVRGAPQERDAVTPLVKWLRRQRTWRGEGWIEITVGVPEAVARAFAVPGAIRSYQALALHAGLTWFDPPEWRGGVLHLHDWKAHIMTRLAQELYRRAQRDRPGWS